MQLLTDQDITAISPAKTVGWIREAVKLHGSGALESPARVSAKLAQGKLTFTAGADPRLFGFRSYDTLPTTAGEQVTVVHERDTGRVAAIHIGNDLGAMRTGALGGVAASLIGPVGPCELAMIGTGEQAWRQLWALSATLNITVARVFSRNPDARRVFCERARTELGINAAPAESAKDAVTGADAVVLATNSATAVIDSAWLKGDVMVTTMGPKQVGRAEFKLDLVTGADLVVTDSLAQLRAYDPPSLVADAGLADHVKQLSDLLAVQSPAAAQTDADRNSNTGPVSIAGNAAAPTVATPRNPRQGRRVYLSVGLAGTEVHLLGRIAEHLRP